ncbi:HAD-IIB family hydrolase [Pseudorhodoferax sp.]|uniref:HAD-IIB family hydrolase n=1 Tax=Pseudorhodoferax sp. TaxID=1993553 RepID=UPI003FA6D174
MSGDIQVDPRQAGRPAPLRAQPLAAWADVRGVMTDIDDTLTRDGTLEPAARQALQDLFDAGLPAIAITGRPLGWSEQLTHDWPLAAVVAENGAVALVREGRRVHTEYAQDAATRAHNAERLRAVAAQVLREVPGACLADDSPGRVTDIAIDHGEFHHLGAEAINQVVALMRAAGMNATVSSIHINGWFGEHNKLSAAHWMLRRLHGRELADEIGRWVYVGDSTNDQQMFAAFPLAVGVANLRRFGAQLHTWPAYITEAERGAGFAEVAAAVLAAR